jgi:hypothetical protein
MEELEKLFRQAGITEDDWDRNNKYIRCMAHIFNLAVIDILKALATEAFPNEEVASASELTELRLKDPFFRLRKWIVAVSFK